MEANHTENMTSMVARLEQLTARLAELETRQAESEEARTTTMDTKWILSSGIWVLLMQLGFAMYESGAVREQNVVATYAKNLLDLVLGVLVASMFGYNLAYPADEFYAMALDGSPEAQHSTRQSIFFHLVFQATAATIVSGAMAERTSLFAYLAYSLFMSGVIYALAVRATWGGGYLYQLEPSFHDFAGSGIVHMLGGVAALTGAALVGSRTGRWDVGNTTAFQPHNIPSMVTGVILLWCGWYGFNPGSTLALSTLEDAGKVSATFITTTYAAAFGGATNLFLSIAYTKLKSCDIISVANGILAGLVSITAGCDCIDPANSAVVGIMGAFTYLVANQLCEKLHIDDVVGAFPVHGACGVWGVFAVGLFHRDFGCLVGGGSDQLKTQAIGVVYLIAVSAVPTFLFLGPLKPLGLLRVSMEEESEGLDKKLGVSAYVHRNAELQECQEACGLLATCNISPQEVLEALENLASIIARPFSPQAGDNKLNGEIQDILDHFDFTNALIHDDNEPIVSYLSFCSHHKKDAGEAARVLVDTMRRALQQNNKPERESILRTLPAERWVFLDSNNLKDLTRLCDNVCTSQNQIIMLTRTVLKRPWVLAEIVKGHLSHRNVVCVSVEWPEREKDPRYFHFPQDLHKAISQWKQYVGATTVGPTLAMANTSLSGDRDVQELRRRLVRRVTATVGRTSVDDSRRNSSGSEVNEGVPLEPNRCSLEQVGAATQDTNCELDAPASQEEAAPLPPTSRAMVPCYVGVPLEKGRPLEVMDLSR